VKAIPDNARVIQYVSLNEKKVIHYVFAKSQIHG
jgi:hypothetical protein